MKAFPSAALVSLVLACCAALADDDQGPGEWLQKMAGAVQTTNYDGTVVRIQNGSSEALKVVHMVVDGVIREKMIVQEGNGMEIIRNGNEVHCILPDRKSVLVEEWDDQSTLFSTLPSSDIRFGSEYDVSIVRQERVAGRNTVMLAIRPHDDFRYGHRIWLDYETGFPLQTKLMGSNGVAIEQVKFADINLSQDIHANQLEPSTDIGNFRWFSQTKAVSKVETESDWVSSDLPPGFRVTSTHIEQVQGNEEPVVHMMISDGLANVSVFIEPRGTDDSARNAQAGAANSFSLLQGNYRVTAVGEVPPATAEHIARSMQMK
jgi:sigma-E factor negative regulatory protein RseB